jgi:hypothetical protein
VISTLIEIFGDAYPVDGYLAGLEACRGKLFIPRPPAVRAMRARLSVARERLHEIKDRELREAANKLLASAELDFSLPKPDQQVTKCAEGLVYILFKGDHLKAFVATYLRNAARLLEFELRRWRGQPFHAEIRRVCLDAAVSLRESLKVLRRLNPQVTAEIRAVRVLLARYERMFFIEGIDAADFDDLFALFEREGAPAARTEAYETILRDALGYGMTGAEILELALKGLNSELRKARRLARRVAVEQLALPADSSLEDVYAKMCERYELGDAAIVEARRAIQVINRFTDEYLQDIGRGDFIYPEVAPPYLVPLITSGAAIPVDYLTDEPQEKVFLTEDKNRSRLTMMNVLIHEAAHAYHCSVVATTAASPLLKLRSYHSVLLSEAMAFHREIEFSEALKKILKSRRQTPLQRQLLECFGDSPLEQRRAILAFELETHLWRVQRFLRAIFDARLNLGLTSYVDFVKWASERTTFSLERIHQQCFYFLTLPGYAPSYAVCGMVYAEIQAELTAKGVGARSFNTRAARMGLHTWGVCQTKMRKSF